MLKKFTFATVTICALPFLSPGFRAGFKMGWNEKIDEFARQNVEVRFVRKFKNV